MEYCDGAGMAGLVPKLVGVGRHRRTVWMEAAKNRWTVAIGEQGERTRDLIGFNSV